MPSPRSQQQDRCRQGLGRKHSQTPSIVGCSKQAARAATSFGTVRRCRSSAMTVDSAATSLLVSHPECQKLRGKEQARHRSNSSRFNSTRFRHKRRTGGCLSNGLTCGTTATLAAQPANRPSSCGLLLETQCCVRCRRFCAIQERLSFDNGVSFSPRGD